MGKHSAKKVNNRNHKNKDKLKSRKGKKNKVDEIDLSDEDLKKIERKKAFRKKLFKLILLFLIILLIYIGITCYRWVSIAKEMMPNTNSIIVDSNGTTIATLGSERINKNVSLSELPENLKDAYIAIEDKRFYNHHGVDVRRTASAAFSYILHAGSSSFGGSTITQQLVKNITGDNQTSIIRKVKEWIKAFELELFSSKEEILQTYLNIIYVGPNIYGVEMGAQYYFSKSATNLSLAECAFLAGINNTPNSYNPFGDTDNSEKISNRTNTVLKTMLEQNYINEDEYNSAIAEVSSGLNFKKGDISSESDGVYSYHTDAVISEVLSDISDKKKIDSDFATNYLYMAGLTIHSTQDSNIQTIMETEFEKNKHIITNNGSTSQASMVIMDHSTGYVVGCVGGLGKKDTVRGFNRATQSLRQNGSAGKPLSVLVPAIDKNIITASSIYDDTKSEFMNTTNEIYSPRDNDNHYLGNITVRRAIESSQNIPFVRIMEQVTPKTSIKYLEKMGISTLTDKDDNLALALGGLDKGVSNLEMSGAYATIANNGTYIEPTFYTTIDNSKGKTIMKSKQKKRRVFSRSVAFILKSLLKQPVEGSHGTATNCAISGMDVAAKTGTTDNNCDKWLCGFTDYYTAVTWYGYDSNESIEYSGHNPASVIWSAIMNSIHKNLESRKFTIPTDIEAAAICPTTGLLANSGCPDAYTEYFLKNTFPNSHCNIHNNSGSSSSNSSSSQPAQTTSPQSNTQITENIITNTTQTQNTVTNNITTQNTVAQNTITSDTNTSTTNNTAINTNTAQNNTTNTSTTNSISSNSSTDTNNTSIED